LKDVLFRTPGEKRPQTNLKRPQAWNLNLAGPNKAAPQLCEMELYRVQLSVMIGHVV